MRDSECMVKHVYGHPERRHRGLPQSSWSEEQRGIYVADRVAGGEDMCQSIGDSQIMNWLSFRMQLRLLVNGTVLIEDCLKLHETRMVDTYLADRDRSRAESVPPRPPRWAGTTTTLMSAMYKGKPPGQSMRMCFDKTWHGGNKWKGGGDSSCSLCTGNMESQKHILRECRHEMRVIRRVNTMR
jgi:hypothetical protein